MYKLLQTHFRGDMENVPSNLQMDVIDIQWSLKNPSFEINDLVEFYSSLPSDFKESKKSTQQIITVFGHTHLCEQSFSNK